MTEPAFELSPSTGRDQVILVVRDPDWGYAIWEVTGDGLASCEASLGRFAAGARLVMRLYTLSAGGGSQGARRHSAEYVLDEWFGVRPILLGPQGARQQVVVGLCGESGTFAAIARSRPVHSPRTRPTTSTPSYVRVGISSGPNGGLTVDPVAAPPPLAHLPQEPEMAATAEADTDWHPPGVSEPGRAPTWHPARLEWEGEGE